MIIWTLVGTLLSLAMILLSYFGIVRYFTLHVSGMDKLVENYSKLPKGTDDRVVVSVAADPKNFHKLKPVLNSILDQTVKVNQIGVVVPLKYENDVPAYIKKIANIFPAGKNYGDGTPLRSFLTNLFIVFSITWNKRPFVIGSKFVSFPNPRSCETLKTPLEAYEYEKEIIREKTEINIILIKFFIIIISFQINIIFIYY